jgi:ferric-dicitrate binding protein FerR (iron transport regulator)
MIDDADGHRLARYIAGECSREEAEEIRRWIAADPAREELLASLEQVWQATGKQPANWDVEGAWKELVAARESRRVKPLRRGTEGSDTVAPRFFIRHSRSLLQVAIAASVILVAGTAIGYIALINRHSIAAPAPAPMRLYATARGERADFHLTDGTRVILGVDSRMRVPADYGARDRTIHLEGEAYFEVLHDANRPFLVRTANAVTEDLGTRFAITAYQGDSLAHVVVAEGKVALRPAGSPVGSGTALSPGDLGKLDASGIATVTSGVDVDRYLAWTKGRLVFDDTPLREVLPQLSHWYDVDFEVTDNALASRRLTATVAGEALPQTLELLASSLGLRYERHDRTVTFYRSRTSRVR